MANHPNKSKSIPRPAMHLRVAKQLYPRAWESAELFRKGKGTDFPDWPDWCYLPMAGWYSIVSEDSGTEILPVKLAGDVSRLAALGAWRITQGIYRFHHEMFNALCKTSMEGELPSEVFTRLPEWCIYIETPGMEYDGGCLHGFFVHLEHDANDGRMELRFLMDSEAFLSPVIFHLGNWTVQEALLRATTEAANQAFRFGIGGGMVRPPAGFVDMVQPFLSLVFYICSKEPEYKGSNRPCRPRAKRTKKGWRLFAAHHPRFWHVGHDTGEALEKARASSGDHSGDRARPEPHIRRAHWHGYWSGPKDGERRFDVRWLPPIPVNVDLLDGELKDKE